MGVHEAARQPGAWQREQEHKPQGSLAGAQAVWCHSLTGRFQRKGERKKIFKSDIWIIEPMVHPMLVVLGNTQTPTQIDAAIYSQFTALV